MQRIGLWVAALATALTACVPDREYEEFKTLTDAEWRYNDTLKFETTIDDTAAAYSVYINVRNRESYPYKNLIIDLHTRTPSGEITARTYDLPLYRRGEWLGRGIGVVYDTRHSPRDLRFRKLFREKGTYTFMVQHRMRDSTLVDLTDIGLRIDKVAEDNLKGERQQVQPQQKNKAFPEGPVRPPEN